MNQSVLSGALLAAISLAVVGAAITAEPARNDESEAAAPQLASEPSSEPALSGFRAADPPPTAAAPTVPVRPGLLGDQRPVSVNPTAQRYPVWIRILDIAMEAEVLSVGVDENSRFDVPAADTVGWYQYSAIPGAPGATVLAAHVDYGGRPGAFFHLNALRPGDRIEVGMSDGTVIAYLVSGNTEYDKSELPAEELFRKEGSSVLQLITCGGTFDPEKRSYRANVVVTADPLEA